MPTSTSIGLPNSGSPTLIATGEGGLTDVYVTVAASNVVYVGGPNITASTGIACIGDDYNLDTSVTEPRTFKFTLGPGDKLYGLSAAGGPYTVAVSVFNLGFE